MTALWSRYSDEELALVLDFLTKSCDLITKLQSARPAARKQAPARRRSRAASL